jgi:hypothetical protein
VLVMCKISFKKGLKYFYYVIINKKAVFFIVYFIDC